MAPAPVTPGRQLSSRLTFFYKLVLPVLWLGAFGTVTVTAFVAPAWWRGDMRTARWILLAATAAGGVVFWRTCIPLKRVTLGRASFFVSNYRREIEVPFADVARVSGSRFTNPPVVRLELRRPGPFGERILFMPPARLFALGQHPMVRELREVLSGRVIR